MQNSHTNIYILCQSLVDALVAVTLILTVLIENDGRYFEGPGDSMLCVFWLSRIMLFGLIAASTYNLTAMTVERYLAIVWPVWHKLHMNRKRVVASVAGAWTLALIFNIAKKLPTSRVHRGQCLLYQWPSSGVRQAMGTVTVVLTYFVPLLVIFVTYTHMIWKLRIRVGQDDNGISRAWKNIIRTMVMITAAFVLCHTINQVFFLLFTLGYDVTLQSELYHSSVLLVFINCTINPFIYLVTYQAYQRALWRLVAIITRGRWGANGQVDPVTNTQTAANESTNTKLG